MSTSTTKIKVRVADLIAKIEAARDEARAQAETNATENAGKLEEWKAAATAEVDRWAIKAKAQIADGKSVDRYFESHVMRPYFTEFSAAKFDRDIGTLRIAAEDSITITAADYGRYLG